MLHFHEEMLSMSTLSGIFATPSGLWILEFMQKKTVKVFGRGGSVSANLLIKMLSMSTFHGIFACTTSSGMPSLESVQKRFVTVLCLGGSVIVDLTIKKDSLCQLTS